MKILVTGGAGFIGSHIADKLIQDGHDVVIVDNLSGGKKENINSKAKFYNIDIRDFNLLETVFAGEKPDIVNHHAAQTDVTKSMKDPIYDVSVNVSGSVNVIELSRKYKVKKINFASTSVVYPDTDELPTKENHVIKPTSVYGLTKYTIEEYLRLYFETYGLKYTAFRYGNVYGPRQDPNGESGVVAIFSKQLLEKKTPTIYGDGTKTRDYVYIDDVVEANIIAIGKGDGAVFNISNAKEITDFEVFDTIRNKLNIKTKPAYTKKRIGELEKGCLNNAKAKGQLGWYPKISFDVGIEKAVNYYREMNDKNIIAAKVE